MLAAWGWPRPGTGGTGWPGGGGRRHPAFWPPQSSAFVFSLCFPSVWPQRPSRLPLIVCRVIKGQMSRRSLAAVGSPSTDTMAAGGWLRGALGGESGLPPAALNTSLRGTLHTALTLIPATPGAKHEGLRFTEEKTETQKAQPETEPWPLGFPIGRAALGLTPLAM